MVIDSAASKVNPFKDVQEIALRVNSKKSSAKEKKETQKNKFAAGTMGGSTITSPYKMSSRRNRN